MKDIAISFVSPWVVSQWVAIDFHGTWFPSVIEEVTVQILCLNMFEFCIRMIHLTEPKIHLSMQYISKYVYDLSQYFSVIFQ